MPPRLCPGECIFIEVEADVGASGDDEFVDLVDLADDAAA